MYHHELVVSEDGKTEREKEGIHREIEFKNEEELRDKIESLKKEEGMIDIRAIESALEEGKIERAGKLLVELEEEYKEYKEVLEELKSVDSHFSTLSEKLARGEIDNDSFKSAKEGLETKKSNLEEKLNKLRKEVIHEDYEKPF